MSANNILQKNQSVKTPVNPHDGATIDNQPNHYRELWPILRGLLALWAVAVWLLLVMMPGMQQVSNFTTALLHLPQVFIGLGLVGAIFAAYSLRSDAHLLWFLVVLLLLAGWM